VYHFAPERGGGFPGRSYWIPGSYASALSEKRNSSLRLLENKGFKKESMTKVELDALGKSTTLESNKSLPGLYGTSFLARLSSYREEDGHTIVMHQRW
jgi:hypothetical protein